ncbi:MAG: helix-turn-helix domain-containing protein [Clostridia bacterium]|nr:helix-turn-helix domain-containing protein [Clostridia bacterium]
MKEHRGIALESKIEVNRLISDFYYELPEDFDYAGEKHPGWEFVYVENGKVVAGVEGSTYLLKKGELICHKPYEFHSIKPYEGKASVVIICFESESEYMQYFNNKILSINQMQKHYLNDIVEVGKKIFYPKDPLDIVRDGSMDPSPEGTELQEQFVKNAIELLVLSLMNSEVTEKQNRVSLYEHFSQRQTLAKSIIEYLSAHIDEEINLAEVAGYFSYSLSSIKRIFKEVTGYSIISYLINLRLQKAKKLLTETNLPIEAIASGLGYSNIYYFSTAFKKRWGVSPSRYRSDHSAS